MHLAAFGRFASLWGDWEEVRGWERLAGKQSEYLKRDFSG